MMPVKEIQTGITSLQRNRIPRCLHLPIKPMPNLKRCFKFFISQPHQKNPEQVRYLNSLMVSVLSLFNIQFSS